MKTQIRLVSMFVMLFCTAGSFAQGAVSPFNWRGDNGHPFISMRSVAEGGYQASSYSPTIYEVGTSAVPSDAYNPFPLSAKPQQFAVTTEEKKDNSVILRGFDTPDEPGQSDESPIGDPLSLALFALLFAGIVGYRTRLKKTSLKRDHHGIIS